MKNLRKTLIPLLIAAAVFFNPLTVSAANISSGSTFASTDGTSGRLVINSVNSSISGSTWNVSINFTINMVNSWLYTGGADYERYFSAVINGVGGGSMQIKARTESWSSGTSRSFTYNMSLPVNPDNNVASASFRVADGNNALNDVATFDTGGGNTVTLQAVQKAIGLSLNAESKTLHTNETFSVIPTVSPSNTYNKNVNYSTSNAAVATVSSGGVITAKKAGTANITVTTADGSNISRTVSVTVLQYVTSISTTVSAPIVYAGETFQLSASAEPNDASNKTLNYNSGNMSIATVNGSGLITAIKAGSTTITVSAADGSGVSKTVPLTVRQKAASIAISNPITELYIGATHQLNVGILPADTTDKSVSFSSSDPAIAAVSESGLITPIKKGTVTITASTWDSSNLSTSMTFTVKKYVQSITLSDTNLTLYTGENKTVTVSVLPEDADNKTYSFTSSNTAVATVTSAGKITAVKAGSATVTVIALDRSTVTSTVRVTVLQKATSISIDKSITALYTGTAYRLRCTVLPLDTTDKSVTFSSSDTSVLTIDETGLITAKKAGTAIITIRTADGSNVSGSVNFTICQHVTDIVIDEIPASMYTGEHFQLSAAALPEDATNKMLSYTSSDTAVAEVNESGLITALKAGSTDIIIAAMNGTDVTKTLPLTVKQKAESIEIANPADEIYLGDTYQLSVNISPEDTTDKSVGFSLSDESIAAISETGLITPVKKGTVKVTVKTKDSSNLNDSFDLKIRQHVHSMTLSQSDLTLYTGENETIDPVILPEDADNKHCSFTSSDESVASVNGRGKITAVKAGTAVITIQSLDDTDIKSECRLTVKQYAEKISIDQNQIELISGAVYKIPASVFPEDTTDQSLSYESSEMDIASIDENGMLTAKNPGTAKVTITASDRETVKAVLTVNVIRLISSIEVPSDEIELYTEQSVKLNYKITPDDASNKNVTFESSYPDIAKVDTQGNINAVSPGTAIITIKADDENGFTKEVVVTVRQSVTSLLIGNENITLNTGDTYRLDPVILPETSYNKYLTYTSSSPAAASVDGEGTVTANKAGTAVITVKTADGSNKEVKVKFTIIQPVTGISLQYDSCFLTVGDTLKLKATLTPFDAANKEVIWTSSDEAVVKVDRIGKITAFKEGTAVIKAVSKENNSISAECLITIKAKANEMMPPNETDEKNNPPENSKPAKSVIPVHKDEKPDESQQENDGKDKKPDISDKSENNNNSAYSYAWYEYLFIATGLISLIGCLIYFFLILIKKKKEKKETEETLESEKEKYEK